QLAMYLVIDARDYIAFQRELPGAPQEFGARRIRSRAGFALESRGQRFVVGGVFGRAADVQRQLFFHPAAPHRQIAVRIFGLEQRLDRLVMLEIAFVLAVFFRLLGFARFRHAAFEDEFAREFSQLLSLGQAFGQYVQRAGDRRLGVVDV